MNRVTTSKVRFRIGFILIAGALLFAGCNALKLGQSTDDKAITTQIQARLFDDPVLKLRDIHVTSDKGTVTLTGTVHTELEKTAVERLAGQTERVKVVVNQLTVSSAPAAESPAAMPPAQTAEVTPPQLPTPTSARSEHARAATRRHYAARSSNEEATVEKASPPEAPAANPPAMSAQAAPAVAAPAAAPAPPQAAPPAPPVAVSTAPVAPAVKPPEHITIPSGTFFSVRLIDSIDSARNHAGDEFAASVEVPVMVGDRVVIPRNSDARVRLAQATSAGRMSGRSELKVELVSVTAGGQSYQLETDYHERAGASRGTRTAETVGGGAALGALLGAIVGRGRGAAVGSVAGAGTGAAVEARTHGEQVKIPSETKLDFTLKSPVTIQLNTTAPADR
jgi:hypothetical protein